MAIQAAETETRYQGKQLKIFQFSLISQVGAEGLGNTEGLRKDGRPVYPRLLLAEIRTEWASGGEGTRRPSRAEGMFRGGR